MKIVFRDQFQHVQLQNSRTGELYSLSQLLSKELHSRQLVLHHDVLAPGQRASGPHRHSLVEEVIYVTKGFLTVTLNDQEIIAPEGSLVLFSPQEKQLHTLINHTEDPVEFLGISCDEAFDRVIYIEGEEDEIPRPSSHFDQNLRDIPDNPQDFKDFINSLQAELKIVTHPEKKLQLLEHIGMAQRTLGQLNEAEKTLLQAVALSFTYPRHSRLVQNLIRLGHVYQWQKEFAKAQLSFDQARFLMNENPVSKMLTAAFYQHLGKVYFDQKAYGKAQSEFALALSLRLKMAAPADQIESSQGSLAEAQRRWGRQFSEGVFIRRASPEDAEGVHRAHMRSIREICSLDYSEAEIQVWGHRPYIESERKGRIRDDLVWAIEMNGEIEGYGHLRLWPKEKGHIFALYLTPKAVGQSLGKALMELMLEEARFAQVAEVTLESTINAQNFYRKMGFRNDGPEKVITFGEGQLRCYPMRMEISTLGIDRS